MLKRFMTVVGILVTFFAINITQAQDAGLRVLTLDYLGSTLETSELGLNIDLTVVGQKEFEGLALEGRLAEFDLVLVDNQVIDPILPELGDGIFIPLCERNPEFCPQIDPNITDICIRHPFLRICGDPCPPTGLSCVARVAWDIQIVVGPSPEPWTLDRLIETVNVETVMVDPRNGMGFYLKPEVFNLARPNLTINFEEAALVFTPACNYIAHYDEFTEMGLTPIIVEGYQETPFDIGAYVVAEGNVDLATEFTSMLINDTELQMGIYRATGLLPVNIDVLNEILPA